MASQSIDQWCRSHNISRRKFYYLEDEGKAPRTFNIGKLRRVSDEADAEWTKAREIESAGRIAARDGAAVA
jgi:hypothetical protein